MCRMPKMQRDAAARPGVPEHFSVQTALQFVEPRGFSSSSCCTALNERLHARHRRVAAMVSAHVGGGQAVNGVPSLADRFSKNHDEQL
jgi:hypothetical protein